MNKKPKKTAGDKTRERILKAGLKLWPNITVSELAKRTGMTHPNILYHFPGGIINEAVAEYAVKTKNVRVIVQLIAVDHPAVADFSPSERTEYFKAQIKNQRY